MYLHSGVIQLSTVIVDMSFWQVADRIKSTTQDLGHACHNLVKNAGTVQGNPTDNLAKKDLVDNARMVCEKVQSKTISPYFVSWLVYCLSWLVAQSSVNLFIFFMIVL